MGGGLRRTGVVTRIEPAADVLTRTANVAGIECPRRIPLAPPASGAGARRHDELRRRGRADREVFAQLARRGHVGLLINQMVLLWEFRTLRLSLVVLCAVPLGLVGSILGLALTGQHFGFIASLGISSLGGIVTNHAIVLFEICAARNERG